VKKKRKPLEKGPAVAGKKKTLPFCRKALHQERRGGKGTPKPAITVRASQEKKDAVGNFKSHTHVKTWRGTHHRGKKRGRKGREG